MPSIRLKVLRPSAAGEPSTATVSPLFRGNGDTDYVCGSCEAVIASRMGPNQHVIVDSTVCPRCGAQNEFPVSLRA